jgi:ATP-dependent helicase HrpB
MLALPIDALLPDIVATLSRSHCLVLQAPPGAGKTTRVPTALLDAGLAGAGDIVVLEPRRIAARMAARRVAEERGEEVGRGVGYEVRFERAVSASTRVRFVTEGILTQRILGDPALSGTSIVVLDEFHERHLHGDFALAWVKRLCATSRPDLRVVVMSATLETAHVARFLDAPTLTSEGRAHPVTIDHASAPDDRPLEQQVASAVRALVTADAAGDVLVFLPGAAEIRRAIERCGALTDAHSLDLVPLHGDLPASAQDAAVRKGARQKVIFATNVAETSITIPGVTAVIDTGLARVARHDPWSGRPKLDVAKISRASAAQRAGRAGREGPGRALRLYTKGDHDTRPEHDVPEILRADLSELVLWSRASGAGDPTSLAWLDAPPSLALSGANALLERIGAIASGELSDTGRSMMRFALPPRLARLVVEAERLGVGDDGCLAAAILADGRDLYARSFWERAATGADETSDLGPRLYDFRSASGSAREGRSLGLDTAVVASVERVYRQLARASRAPGATLSPAEADERLRRAVLAAFPDRVAKRREGDKERLSTSRELVLSSGGTAVLAEGSQVRTAPFLVLLEVADRNKRTTAWLASAIEPEWLIDLAPSAVRETLEVRWDDERERVIAVERMLYDRIVLDERPAGSAADEAAARLLIERATAGGLAAFVGGDAWERLRARIAFVCETAPDLASGAGLSPLGDERLRDLLARRLAAKRSFAELRAMELLDEIRAEIGHAALARLDGLAPEHVVLGNGRRSRIAYEPGKLPWIESRLQDFFGSGATPRILGGRAPLVVHLLAPNGRAVQVTTDLEGFWLRTYPELRVSLMRRYPRHAWPEDPRRAVPPPLRANRPKGN